MIAMLLESQEFDVVNGRYLHLKNALAEAPVKGFHCEFGVHSASTLNFLAALRPEVHWWGFDTFTGLPNDWIRSFDGKRRSEKGDFAVARRPRVEPNVTLVAGLFADTLPTWESGQPTNASFLHIDSDLYGSCRDILFTLNDRIVPGTVIVLDELRDWHEQGVYERWREGEWAALVEWVNTFNRKILPLFRTDWLEASVKVVL